MNSSYGMIEMNVLDDLSETVTYDTMHMPIKTMHNRFSYYQYILSMHCPYSFGWEDCSYSDS